MVRAHLLGPGGTRLDVPVEVAADPPEGQTAWFEMEAPSEPELAELSERWHFHRLAIEDCIHPQLRSKFERYPSHGFVVLMTLDPSTPDDPLDSVSIRVFLRPRLVVTVCPKPSSAIDAVYRRLREDDEHPVTSADRLLWLVADATVDELLALVEEFGVRLEALSREVAASGVGLSDRLVAVRHDLLLLRRTIAYHLEVIKRFLDADAPEVSTDTRVYFRDVYDHATVVADTIAVLLELCNGALQVQANANTDRLNKVMKYLAIVNTLLLPMTVISGAFGMNFARIPISEQPWGFWTAVGLMLGSALALLAWFRTKRWF